MVLPLRANQTESYKLFHDCDDDDAKMKSCGLAVAKSDSFIVVVMTKPQYETVSHFQTATANEVIYI